MDVGTVPTFPPLDESFVLSYESDVLLWSC